MLSNRRTKTLSDFCNLPITYENLPDSCKVAKPKPLYKKCFLTLSTAFPRHFRVFFRCNFADREIRVDLTYFFQRNFDGRKIHVFSTYFSECNFDGRKIHVVSMYFSQCNLSGRDIHGVFTYFFLM